MKTNDEKAAFNITRQDVDGISIKYIANTHNMFAASKTGAIYSFSGKMRGKIIGTRGAGGYITCSILFADGKRKTIYAHRLVAETFIPNPENKKQVCHLDGDRTNNCVDNLCWSTAFESCNLDSHCENMMQSVTEYYRSRNVNGRSPVRVAIIDKHSHEILEITSSIQAAGNWIHEQTGKSSNGSTVQISGILANKQGFKTCGGYMIRRACEDEFQDWIKEHPDTEILDDVDIKKLPKDGVLQIVNRKLNMKTGEMEYEVNEFNKGDRITNELK